MSTSFTKLLACVLLGVALSVNEESADSDGGLSAQSLTEAFARTQKMQQESMDAISQSLTLSKAVAIVRKSKFNTPALTQVIDMAVKGQANATPYNTAPVDKAKEMLNEMIYQSMEKYDEEIMRCTQFYSRHCGDMEECRGKIAQANYEAANARMLILHAQGNINRCEEDIPMRRYELKQHLLKCKADLYKLNTRLKLVEGDIAVMTRVLEMTDCDSSFVQTNNLVLMRCIDPCTQKSFLSFGHPELQKKMAQLQSSYATDLISDTFKDWFEGAQALQSYSFANAGTAQMPVINKTKFNNPPVPFTKVPADPCTDPNAGAPASQVKTTFKTTNKCAFVNKTNCYRLQEKFLLIQSGIKDEQDELLEEISMLESFCEETKLTLEKQISDDLKLLADSQTKLAAAMTEEATAGETARTTADEHDKLEKELKKQMDTCTNQYRGFESELCALKKIRGELYKLRGTGNTNMFFQDCAVSKWHAEECSKSCDGGRQWIKRSILTHADGGAKCLPLTMTQWCNNQPCPVDCKVTGWGDWSKCSAQCGGGVTQRLKDVLRAARNGGDACPVTSQTKACANQACEKDCDLTDWTGWTTCSKLCDGGTYKRMKFIKKEPIGAGKCADEWSPKRLQYKACNMHRCPYAMKCNRTLDVVLLIDGSGSLGQAGWDASIKASKILIEALAAPSEKKVDLAVILFSGPRTWSGVDKCIGATTTPVSLAFCGIKTVTSFTNDMTQATALVDALTWPRGSTLTSLALMTAKGMLNLGRQNVHSVVVVMTDGRPMSYRKTTIASREIRKMARLVWVPVTNFAPLGWIKLWATRRWQENVVQVDDFVTLAKGEVMTHVVADICPDEIPEVEYVRA